MILGRRLPQRLEIAFEVAALVAGLILMRAISGASHDDLQVLLFYHYGHSFWFGNPPLHTLPVEYPPLSILLFTLTVVPPIFAPIMAINAYTIWMSLLALISYALFRHFEGTVRARLAAVAILIATGSVLLISYDLAPALATLGALWAVERRRFTLAYILIAVGILLKLYPAALLPVVAIEQLATLSGAPAATAAGLRQRLADVLSPRALGPMLRGVAVCLALVILVFAGSFLLNANGTLSEFRFASQRPLQFESVPATLLWISHFFGVPVHLEYGFGAFNWVSPDDGPFRVLSVVLLVCGCLFVYWQELNGRLNFKQAFLAILCVVVATNKVLSPQYFIWLLPIVVAVDCFDGIWLLICALTLVEYPLILPLRHHLSLNSYYTVVDGILILRNGLLILATARALLGRSASLVSARPVVEKGQRPEPVPI
ncbi:MAG: hypothetical protein ACLQUY_05470 [Ktedonobacterales bacterium]